MILAAELSSFGLISIKALSSYIPFLVFIIPVNNPLTDCYNFSKNTKYAIPSKDDINILTYHIKFSKFMQLYFVVFLAKTRFYSSISNVVFGFETVKVSMCNFPFNCIGLALLKIAARCVTLSSRYSPSPKDTRISPKYRVMSPK